jgi:hypothetical protein
MWQWEHVDEDRSGSSGDLAKLFKNEKVKQPGVLAVAAPPEDATLLAREAIQNSWDAAISLKRQLGLARDDEPRFELRFLFRDVVGEEKVAIVERLGLAQLGDRITEIKKSADADDRAAVRTRLGLAESDCLDNVTDSTVPLRLLTLEESATTGMGGRWQGAASKLYLALVSVGFTVKDSGSGGSYGYGKAGLIRASHTRTVLAHTCFAEDPDEPGVTARFLGMTYWGKHDVGPTQFTGFARLGQATQSGSSRPFQNEAADEWAVALGMPERDPTVIDQRGSTFLIVDPTVKAHELCHAVERSWWPALIDNQFDVEIVDADGTVLRPRPKKNDTLRPFWRGWELATTPQDNDVDNELRRNLGTYNPQGGSKAELGTIGLVADLEGWSYAQGAAATIDGESVDHQSLVALVRGPRMVVEYYELGRAQPYVRGTFVAHDDIDDLLRQTEPKAHDAWQRRISEEGVDPVAPKVADQVLKRIGQAVKDFRKKLTPPTPREQDIRLPLLDDLLRSIFDEKGKGKKPPPPPPPRTVSINVTQAVEAVREQIRLVATVRLALTDNIDSDEAECEVALRYAWDEDGRRGENQAIDVAAPVGFSIVEAEEHRGTVLRGPLSHELVDFEITSAPYQPDWTGQLIVTAEPLQAVGVATASASGANDEATDDEQ